ncbi:hypothetical protein GF357_03640 [Candidatus Dojkabacteria bacterium]|nr:hypothetical protein [Candidatus Dojkabacteria bacterium]
MEPIVIKLSKKKIILWLTLSIGFVALGFWLLSLDKGVLSLPKGTVTLIAILDIVLFSFGVVFNFKKLLDNKPGMIITEEGITDNSSAISMGFVPWEDIIGLSVNVVNNQKYLTVRLRDMDARIEQAKGLRKYFMEVNNNNFGSGFQVSTTILDYNFDDLYNIIVQQLKLRGVEIHN